MNRKSVVVAGVGNIGSHFGGLLARMPEVGRVALIDRDTYEERNVVNQDILPGDEGKPKVLVQARRMAEIRPDLEVNAIRAAAEDLPLGMWRADLIVACLDSRAARQTVNERAWRLGVPWIDSGVMGSQSLARVNAYAPGVDAPCLECKWSEIDFQQIEQEYLCGAGKGSAPNGASAELGALAAALLAVECRKMLTGEFDSALIGRQATLNARWHRHTVTTFRRNPACRFDHATLHIEPLPCSVNRSHVADLLLLGEEVRVPNHRFVRRLICPSCGKAKQIFHLAGSLDASAKQCDACEKTTMVAAGFDIVETLDGNLPAEIRNLTLAEIGLRRGDVIRVRDRYFEIAADTVIANL